MREIRPYDLKAALDDSLEGRALDPHSPANPQFNQKGRCGLVSHAATLLTEQPVGQSLVWQPETQIDPRNASKSKPRAPRRDETS